MYKDFGSFTYEAWRRSLSVCPLAMQLLSELRHIPAACKALPRLLNICRTITPRLLAWLKCSSRVLHGVVGASEDYSALQSGKTEYKSVTVAEDSTAEEFMDFYLDDDTRATWVSCSPPPVHLNSALYLCLCSAHWAKPRAAAYISQPCFHNLLSEGHSTCITMRFLTTSSDCDSR